jgi:dihydroorotate dehydrogenase
VSNNKAASPPAPPQYEPDSVSWFYRGIIRPVLFTQEAEKIHDRALRLLAGVSRHKLLLDIAAALYGAPELPVELFGLRFPNPVGLAAGMDKWAQAVPAWRALGFGFSELGGVTWHAQPGNPAPRLFRAPADEAIVNSMGFNNPGAAAFAEALARWKQEGRWPDHPVGVNLGKSKITPLEMPPRITPILFASFAPTMDFCVVNVSSPNTPNLRQLQDKSALDEILAALQENNTGAAASSHFGQGGAGPVLPGLGRNPGIGRAAPPGRDLSPPTQPSLVRRRETRGCARFMRAPAV